MSRSPLRKSPKKALPPWIPVVVIAAVIVIIVVIAFQKTRTPNSAADLFTPEQRKQAQEMINKGGFPMGDPYKMREAGFKVPPERFEQWRNRAGARPGPGRPGNPGPAPVGAR